MSPPGRESVTLEIRGEVAQVTFDRPAARNALTLGMYRQLEEACDRIDATEGLRVAVLRGAGGAFVAGTDIAEFAAFAGAEDGLRYEERVEAVVSRLEALSVPTLAVVEGPAVGGGMILSAACDLRIVTPEARFGVPVARTLGNCLSVRNVARLERAVGGSTARRMLLLADLIDGRAAERLGFAVACVEPERIEEEVAALTARLAALAPLTLAASREAFRAVGGAGTDGAALIARVYGSRDFAEGVRAFLEKRRPRWEGR